MILNFELTWPGWFLDGLILLINIGDVLRDVSHFWIVDVDDTTVGHACGLVMVISVATLVGAKAPGSMRIICSTISVI